MGRPRITPRDEKHARKLESSRKWYGRNKETVAAAMKVYWATEAGRAAQARHDEKRKADESFEKKKKARNTLNNAVNSGKVVRPDTCDVCKLKKKVQGHHHDYDKPLDVVWMCTACHANEHSEDIPSSHNCPAGTSASRDAVTTAGPEHKETQPMP